MATSEFVEDSSSSRRSRRNLSDDEKKDEYEVGLERKGYNFEWNRLLDSEDDRSDWRLIEELPPSRAKFVYPYDLEKVRRAFFEAGVDRARHTWRTKYPRGFCEAPRGFPDLSGPGPFSHQFCHSDFRRSQIAQNEQLKLEREKNLRQAIRVLRTVTNLAQTRIRAEADRRGRQLIQAKEAAVRQRNAEILDAALPASVEESLPEPIEPETALADHESKAEPGAETAQAGLDKRADEVGERSEEVVKAETDEAGNIEAESVQNETAQAEIQVEEVVEKTLPETEEPAEAEKPAVIEIEEFERDPLEGVEDAESRSGQAAEAETLDCDVDKECLGGLGDIESVVSDVFGGLFDREADFQAESDGEMQINLLFETMEN